MQLQVMGPVLVPKGAWVRLVVQALPLHETVNQDRVPVFLKVWVTVKASATERKGAGLGVSR